MKKAKVLLIGCIVVAIVLALAILPACKTTGTAANETAATAKVDKMPDPSAWKQPIKYGWVACLFFIDKLI